MYPPIYKSVSLELWLTSNQVIKSNLVVNVPHQSVSKLTNPCKSNFPLSNFLSVKFNQKRLIVFNFAFSSLVGYFQFNHSCKVLQFSSLSVIFASLINSFSFHP